MTKAAVFFRGLTRSFPVQLFVLHFRSNTLLTSVWVLLALMVAGSFGRRFGLHYLFLDPEYLGRVSFWSFFLVGFSFSGLLMAWQTTVYIVNAYRFPFLASLSRPFAKFCINNSLVPVSFVAFYIGRVVHFQWYNQFEAEYSIFFLCTGFFFGMFTGLFGAYLYFQATNKDILFFTQNADPLNVRRSLRSLFRSKSAAKEEKPKEDIHRHARPVEFYLTEYLRPRPVRSVAHYDDEMLLQVFRQNHVNALVIQIVGITVLVAVGMLMEKPMARIPAAASIFILFSVATSILGAITYWLREWRALFLIALLVLVNFMTGKGYFDHKNKAYGLDYSTPAAYSVRSLDSLSGYSGYRADMDSTLRILNRWRSRFGGSVLKKPKLVVIHSTGGGLRAAAWTVRVLQQADSVLNGRLFPHTVLMTGASGGMLGLGYLREVYLRQQADKSISVADSNLYPNITKDLVNSVAFAIATNDIFVPWMKFEREGHTYLKDRGYIFEQQLNENLGKILDKRVGDYAGPEREALCPLMFITPVIIEDGRQLVISAQPVSYLHRPGVGFSRTVPTDVDAISARALLGEKEAAAMGFLSALRMNATYPYILPNVYLPTSPGTQVMDAGFRDNFGTKTACRFLISFADWIRRNTDGVVFVDIRSASHEFAAEDGQTPTMAQGTGFFEKIFNPMGAVAKFTDIQDYAHDDLLDHLADLLGERRVHVVRFDYRPSRLNERASLSLHLTKREKLDIFYAMNLPENQQALRQLRKLIR
jgi:hypothetical protein